MRRNLKKAQKNNLILVENVSVEQVVELLKINIGYKVKHLKASGYEVLKKVMKQTLHYQCGFTVGVIDENKQLLAATFCILSKNKIHCILESSTPVGKDSGAMFFMRDEIIKRYGKDKEAFDFEGSSIKGIADFNKSFGAKDCVYLHLKRNTLPYLLKKWSGKYL